MITRSHIIHERSYIIPIKQNEDYATYAPKINKADAKINWHDDALQIERKILSFNPAPGVFTILNSTTLIKIWQAHAVHNTTHQNPGSIIEAKNGTLLIACGNNTVLAILELQIAGKNKQSTIQFLSGNQDLQGKYFIG
jgi:methionyl-tRNA formyltransferase